MKKILIIEDDPDIREVIQDLLLMEGYDVQVAEQGREGLDLLTSALVLPDLIILDLMMPVMDGLELVQKLQQEPKLKTIKVVVLTAGGVCPSEGIVDCLKKPIDADSLMAAVTRHIA